MTTISRYPVRQWNRRAVAVGGAALALALTGTSPAFGQGVATAAPVKVGVILQESGAIVTPEVGAAAEAMIAYFNAERDGAGGQPMEAVLCATDDTVASAVACADEFANADDVHLVIESTTNPTAIADVLAAAGKPLLVGGVDMANMFKPGVFVMEPGAAGIAQAIFSYAGSDMGVTHLTVFLAADPAIESFKPVLDLIAAEAGMTIDAYVSLPFGEADFAGLIAAGIADESDGLAMIVAPPQCAPAGQALEDLAIDLPVVTAELCLIEEVVSTGAVNGWYSGTQSVAPVVDGGPDADEITRILTSYGDGADSGGLAGLGVGYAWIAHDVLEQAGAGEATDASVMQVLSTYTSSDVLGFDEISCPGPGSFVAACNVSTLIVRVHDSEIHDAGGFVESDLSIFEVLLGP